MKVLMVYPGHAVSTIDVAHGYHLAFKEFNDIELSVFNYHNSLLFFQHALNSWYEREVRGKSVSRTVDPATVLQIASEQVVIHVLSYRPDVVLIVNGLALHKKAYDLIYSLDIPIVMFFTESPYADEQQMVVTKHGHSSLAFVNDKNSVEVFEEKTGVKTVYLPHSFNPAVHRVRAPVEDQITDVFFYGTLFPERVVFFEEAFDRKEFKNFDVYIDGLDSRKATTASVKEKQELMDKIMDNRELSYWYNSTKVAVNLHRSFVGTTDNGVEVYIEPGKENPYSIGPRPYEVAACGAFQISDNTRPELKEVFGDSVPTYSNADELAELTLYYLMHERERKEKAALANLLVQECTFKNRAEKIVIPELKKLLGGK